MDPIDARRLTARSIRRSPPLVKLRLSIAPNHHSELCRKHALAFRWTHARSTFLADFA
jgi:hypothetical protein